MGEFSNRATATAPPLATRTGGEAGLALTLHIAFQYHLNRDELRALYKQVQTNYEALFMKLARDILLKVAADFSAHDYWEKRTIIGQQMFNRVKSTLEESYATCTGLQILRIDLPDAFEKQITATQVRKQSVKTSENEQKAAVIRAQIQVMVAQFQNNITVTLARANANANYVTKSAEAKAAQERIQAEDDALEHVKESLSSKGLTLSPEGIVAYQENFAYQNLGNATFLSELSNAVVYVAPYATTT